MKNLTSQIISEVVDTKKNVLINAGAGCGKTSLLVKTAAKIIASDQSVLFLNVTRRAGIEIHSHAHDFSFAIDPRIVRTFHSLCFENLSRWKGTRFSCDSPYWHEGQYEIPEEINGCTDERLLKILNELSARDACGFSPKDLVKILDVHKQRFLTRQPEDRLLASLTFKLDGDLGAVTSLLEKYERFRLHRGLLDFNDGLHIFSYISRRNNANQIYRQYKTVIVDEFQDLSVVHLEILISLASAGCRIILAGDPRQCINTHMGAYIDSIEDLKICLRPKVFSYNDSYRFGQPIAELANSAGDFIGGSDAPLIGNSKRASVPPEVKSEFSSSKMVDVLASEIEGMIYPVEDTPAIKPTEILICYRFTRGNRLASRLKKILEQKKINVVQLPLQRKDQDILEYLIRHTEKSRESTNSNLMTCAEQAIKRAKRIRKYKGPLIKVFHKIASESDSVMDLITDCKDRTVEYLLKNSPDHIVMSTIHSSKGSDYKYVFLLDASQLTFSEKMKFTDRIKSEQAALLYVAITRAKFQFKAIFPKGRRISRLLKPYVAAQMKKTAKNE